MDGDNDGTKEDENAWMVGKVEAPAKANRIELKAGMCLLVWFKFSFLSQNHFPL